MAQGPRWCLAVAVRTSWPLSQALSTALRGRELEPGGLMFTWVVKCNLDDRALGLMSTSTKRCHHLLRQHGLLAGGMCEPAVRAYQSPCAQLSARCRSAHARCMSGLVG